MTIRFDVPGAALRDALATCQPAIAGKNAVPVVLGDFLLSQDGGTLTIGANNLNTAIETTIEVTSFGPGDDDIDGGAVTLPASLLVSMVDHMRGDIISVTATSPTAVQLTGSGATVDIHGHDADNFPQFPTVDQVLGDLPEGLLGQALGRVVVATAAEHTNPILQTAHLVIRQSTIRAEAIDGYRMAIWEGELDTPWGNDLSALIPGGNVGPLTWRDKGTVQVGTANSGGQLVLTLGPTRIATRLASGTFPDVERFLPSGNPTKVKVKTALLTKVLKAAAVVAQAGGNIVVLEAESGAGKLTVKSTSTETGAFSQSLEVVIDGEPRRLALNVTYALEAVAQIQAAEVELHLRGENLAMVLVDTGYTHLVMPMRIP